MKIKKIVTNLKVYEFYCSQITLDDLNLKETNYLFSSIKNSSNVILAKQIPDKKFGDLRNNFPKFS